MVFGWQCYQGLVRVAERDSHGVDHMELATRLWRPRQKGFVLSREDDFSGRDSSQAELHQVQRAKFPSARQCVLGGRDKKTRRDNDGRSRGRELPMRGRNLLLMVYPLLEGMNAKSCNPLKPGTQKARGATALIAAAYSVPALRPYHAHQRSV